MVGSRTYYSWLRRALPFRFRRRLAPLSRKFGADRGLPIDRYYIERFLSRYSEDIRGCVLEVEDASYTRRFGGNRVIRSEVLHARSDNPAATIVGDLATGEAIPRNSFDCVILTQTLQFIYDLPSAILHTHAMLQRGGVLLATMPGISQISRYDMDRWGDYWRFTSLSARRLFEEIFGESHVSVEICGNLLTSTAFLCGLSTEDMRPAELDWCDEDYQMVITVRAVRQ